ncbi:MAG TPA: hypothetical protein VJP77_06960 [Planctomycetota bacterium]|nr:hypothetical protein [Planctomycetota bacterium]
MRLRTLFAAAFVAAVPGLALAQKPGTPMLDEVELEGFAQTEAESYSDLFGRAVLIEFFAYW